MFASNTFLSSGYLVSYGWEVQLNHADHHVAFIYFFSFVTFSPQANYTDRATANKFQ
jgi:hypothetical protein